DLHGLREERKNWGALIGTQSTPDNPAPPTEARYTPFYSIKLSIHKSPLYAQTTAAVSTGARALCLPPTSRVRGLATQERRYGAFYRCRPPIRKPSHTL